MLYMLKLCVKLTKKYVLFSYLDRETFITTWMAKTNFRTLDLHIKL